MNMVHYDADNKTYVIDYDEFDATEQVIWSHLTLIVKKKKYNHKFNHLNQIVGRYSVMQCKETEWGGWRAS